MMTFLLYYIYSQFLHIHAFLYHLITLIPVCKPKESTEVNSVDPIIIYPSLTAIIQLLRVLPEPCLFRYDLRDLPSTASPMFRS